MRWELVVLKLLARMRAQGGVASDLFGEYSRKKGLVNAGGDIEKKGGSNVRARVAWARFTRRLLVKANQRKLTACANLRRLARDLLLRENNLELWRATRW